MIQITAQMRVLVAIEAVDGRKGIDSLVRLCQSRLCEDPFSGCVFIFRSRRGTSYYDGHGWWLAQKRLSQGRIRWWPEAATPAKALEAYDLAKHHPEILGELKKQIDERAEEMSRPIPGAAVKPRPLPKIESFNSKLRDEFLNGEIFYSMKELRVLAERWRVHYNTVRPHSSLGYRPPAPAAWLTQTSSGAWKSGKQRTLPTFFTPPTTATSHILHPPRYTNNPLVQKIGQATSGLLVIQELVCRQCLPAGPK